MAKPREVYQASDAVKALWPMENGKPVSGNEVNGLGEETARALKPIFWRVDGSCRHEPVQFYFYKRDADNEKISASRKYREETQAIPVNPVTPKCEERTAEDWTAAVKEAALEFGADDVGICAYRPEWTYEDRPQPAGKWAVVMGFGHDRSQMTSAPDENAYVEIMRQYARGGNVAKYLSNWIQDRGHVAQAKTGPNTEDVLMIPAAIAAGLGELGKHGSLIHKRLGSSFRLSVVTTDIPLVPDKPEVFGGDQFCESCQLCSNACPPDAISREKVMVNGVRKWYVNFDNCVPFFVDNKTCAICLVVCPWSRPGVADNLLQKMAKRLDR